jgi:PAS domain S-box-containing protein
MKQLYYIPFFVEDPRRRLTILKKVWILCLKRNREILQSKVVPEYLQEMKRRIDEAITQRTVYEMTYEIEPAPGTRRWAYSKGRCRFRLGESDPVSFFGIVQDITHMQLKEQAFT